MGFIEDYYFCFGDQFGKVVFFDYYIGQEQVMVDYYYVGVYCFFMCFYYEIIFIQWVVVIEIVIVGVGYQWSGLRVFCDVGVGVDIVILGLI